jgi:hypothetical protein
MGPRDTAPLLTARLRFSDSATDAIFRSRPLPRLLLRRRASFGIKFRNRLCPSHCFGFPGTVKRGYLLGHSLLDSSRARVWHNQAQLPQTASAAPLAHRPHSISGSCHRLLDSGSDAMNCNALHAVNLAMPNRT